jgi:hypothetical protein
LSSNRWNDAPPACSKASQIPITDRPAVPKLRPSSMATGSKITRRRRQMCCTPSTRPPLLTRPRTSWRSSATLTSSIGSRMDGSCHKPSSDAVGELLCSVIQAVKSIFWSVNDNSLRLNLVNRGR